jgi:hypothetical protein
MQCTQCETQISPDFKYCPECGSKTQSVAVVPEKTIPDRFLVLIEEYETLTFTKLTQEQKMRFIEHPSVGQLSVNDSRRRSVAAKQVLIPNGDGTFRLDVFEWAKAMYEVEDPKASHNDRVWITTGGEKYHRNRDCKGLVDGQSFAKWKGKDTYRPQFVSLKDAAWIIGKLPCEVCKPEKWSN